MEKNQFPEQELPLPLAPVTEPAPQEPELPEAPTPPAEPAEAEAPAAQTPPEEPIVEEAPAEAADEKKEVEETVQDAPVDGAPVEETASEAAPEAQIPEEEAPLNISLWADDPAFLELLVPEGAETTAAVGPVPEADAVPEESSSEEAPLALPLAAVTEITHVHEEFPEDMPNLVEQAPAQEDALAEQEVPREEEPEDAPADPIDQELLEVAALLQDKPRDEKFQADPEDPEAFTQAVNRPPEKPPIPSRTRPARKGRPRKKNGEGLLGIPNILATCIWLVLVVAIGVTLGRMLWVCAADVLAFGREDRPVTITIYESDTIEDITQKLNDAGLIRYPGLFKLYASLAVDEGEIRPGIWDLNTLYDYHALVKMMSPSSSREVVEVMIPEGYSSRQIFQLLEEKKVCTARDIASYAASGELDFYWFLEGIDRGEENCLEGYLFPDTYQFYTNDSPRSVLQKMLNNFDNRFTEEMQAMLPQLNTHISSMMAKDGRDQAYIDAHQMTLQDVIIVASMIEKETSSAEEGHTIASVIYNRLFSWGTTPPYLNIDASMVYALGKNDITAEDLRIDHPYNTYLYTGLTPGPIANPGLASILAALQPSSTGYYYYVLDPAAGSHHFSKTYEEHQAFIASLGG